MSKICRNSRCVFNNPHKNKCLVAGVGYEHCSSKMLDVNDKDGPTYIFTRPALWFCTKDEKTERELLKYFTHQALERLVSYEYLKLKA